MAVHKVPYTPSFYIRMCCCAPLFAACRLRNSGATIGKLPLAVGFVDTCDISAQHPHAVVAGVCEPSVDAHCIVNVCPHLIVWHSEVHGLGGLRSILSLRLGEVRAYPVDRSGTTLQAPGDVIGAVGCRCVQVLVVAHVGCSGLRAGLWHCGQPEKPPERWL